MSYGDELGGYGGYTSTALRDPAMAAALRKQAMGAAMMNWKPEGPVLSPWQGVDALVKGLMGGYFVGQGDSDMRDHAAKQDAEASDFKNNMAGLLMGGQPQAPTPQSSGMGAALSGQPQAGGGSSVPGLGASESGNNPGAVNPGGYAGTYQMGKARMADLGFYKPAPGENMSDNKTWAGQVQVAPYNVTDRDSFLRSPQAQGAVQQASEANVDQAIAKTPGADKLDRNGLQAVAHLGGVAGMQRFVSSGGTYDPADANGTHLSDYYQKFASGGAPRGVAARTGGVDVAGPGAPTGSGVPQGQMPQQAPAAGPDPEAMMARAAQIRQAALQASNHSNPQIAKQATYMEHYADSLERQAQTLQGRIERRDAYTQRAQDKQDAYAQHQADLQANRDLAAANRVPQHITMQDPDGKGVGIYEMTPQGPGRRLGAAPKQPGESSGPFGGNAMEAQANNILLGIGPKIANGTATDQEKGQYSLAYQHLQNGNVQMVPDPTDPSGNRQVLARIPGNIPPQFPPPPGSAQQQSGAAPAPQQAAPGAPQVVPGTTKFAPIPEKIMEGMINNNQAITKIDKALTSLDAHQGSVGPMNSIVPGSVRQYTDPSGVATRALVADIGSLKLHDRSGAAVTAAEEPRLKPFIPNVSDAPATVREKLNNFRQEYVKILGDTYSSYGPKSGGRPLPEIEKTLSGGQQQMAAGQPSPDAVQAELRRRGLLK